MFTQKEIKKLTENLYNIIESDAGRKIVDNILLEKYGAQYMLIKEKMIEKEKR